MRGEVAGEDTLGAISHSLHVGVSGTWVAHQRFCETALGFGSVSECLSSPFQDSTAHLHSMRKGLEKVPQTLPVSHISWPVYLDWRESHLRGRKNKKQNIKVSSLALDAWNVRTLLDRHTANRPERRTALVATELKRYNIDIAALSETRLAEEGQLTEVGATYTFFWIGKSTDERREAGVGFAIKTKLVKQLAGPPKGINDRLMSVRLPLHKKRFATIISVYAPTMTNSENVIEKFCEDLKSVIEATPKADKLIILGDFNARVGADWRTWEGVLGRHGIGKCNSNGLLLLQNLCSLQSPNHKHRLPATTPQKDVMDAPSFQTLAFT